MAFALAACAGVVANTPKDEKGSGSADNFAGRVTTDAEKSKEEISKMKMKVQIGDAVFVATLEDNAAVSELVQMMKKSPVTINIEKVGSLGQNLTASDTKVTTIPGDIVLYNGNNIVMFYGSNSWSYTKIGHIDDLTGWEDALGDGSVTAVFTLAE